MAPALTTRRLLRRALPGFAGWTAALGVFLVLFGVDAVATAASTLADPSAAPLVALGLAATVCWGLSLWRTLRGVGSTVHPVRAVGLFFATTFVNGVTPFGQTGGDPVSAVLVERTTGVDYESGLAALVGVTAINRLVSLVLVLLAGALSLGTRPARLATRLPAEVPVAVVVAGTALAVVGVVGVTTVGGGRPGAGFRRGTALVRSHVPPALDRRLGRVLTRAGRFRDAVERTLTDPTTTGAVVVLGLLGELALGLTLWGTLLLVGATAPLSVVVVSIPLSRLGALAPTPGGAGGVEVALAGLLVGLAGVAPPVAGVAALAFRLLTFALPTVVGGGVVALAVTRG